MANWQKLHLTFEPPLSDEVVEALKAEIKSLDNDAPVQHFGPEGILRSSPNGHRGLSGDDWYCSWRSPHHFFSSDTDENSLIAILERHGANGHGWMMSDYHDTLSQRSVDDANRFTFGTALPMMYRIAFAKRVREARSRVYQCERDVMKAARHGETAELLAARDAMLHADGALAELQKEGPSDV